MCHLLPSCPSEYCSPIRRRSKIAAVSVMKITFFSIAILKMYFVFVMATKQPEEKLEYSDFAGLMVTSL